MMSKSILFFAVIGVSLGLVIFLFKTFKKGTKLAAKLPTNFLIFFLLYAVLGLTGFFMKDQIAQNPVLLGLLMTLVSLTSGVVMTNKLYTKWEWSMEASFGKKLLYLAGILLTSVLTFMLVFLLCEHRGIPKVSSLKSDLVWWLSALSGSMLLPLILKHLHTLWNEIPKILQVKPIFKLPVGSSPPFIESGGRTLKFDLVIPIDYGSKEIVQSTVALPYDKSLKDAFHYKLHDHNIVKRLSKQIIIAEENKRAKIYAWCFYREEPAWWGWFTKKHYLDPNLGVGTTVDKGSTIFVERVKAWE